VEGAAHGMSELHGPYGKPRTHTAAPGAAASFTQNAARLPFAGLSLHCHLPFHPARTIPPCAAPRCFGRWRSSSLPPGQAPATPEQAARGVLPRVSRPKTPCEQRGKRVCEYGPTVAPQPTARERRVSNGQHGLEGEGSSAPASGRAERAGERRRSEACRQTDGQSDVRQPRQDRLPSATPPHTPGA
jgi:hypothetical protein